MIYQNILRFRGGRYALWALVLTGCSAVLFATQGGRHRAGGGTWQGYTLGTVGAVLIVWLSLLGIRKRRYSSTLGTLQGWTSAHVWLGLALVAIVTFHCAGLFGWNIHTWAYILMCVVIGSGLVGLYAYLSIPRQLAANSGGLSRPQLFAELFALDREGLRLAAAADPAVSAAVSSSIERTSIGGGVLHQLLGSDRSLFLRPDTDPPTTAGRFVIFSNADQRAVMDLVGRRVPQASKRAEAATLQELVVLLSRRQAVLRRIRRDIQLQAALQLWSYVHVPLSFALLAALLAHILATFIYF